jgi:hypothetical protein
MTTLFAVLRTRGAAWDARLGLRQQALWNEHAAWVDAAGFTRLAGPLQDVPDVPIVVRADDACDVETRMAADRWTTSGHLTTTLIAAWDVLVGGSALAGGAATRSVA